MHAYPPRSSPTADPLATEHSSGTLVLPSMSRYSRGSSRISLCLAVYLSLYVSLFLSFSLPLAPSPVRFLSHFSSKPPSSPKNRRVRYYRRHITNAELVVIDWMPGTWICQLMWQTNPFRSSFSPRSPLTTPRFCVCRTSESVSRA